MECKLVLNGEELDLTPLVIAITQSVLEEMLEQGKTVAVPTVPVVALMVEGDARHPTKRIPPTSRGITEIV